MSTSSALASTTDPLTPVASAINAQFANPPDLQTVVRTMLEAALKEKYPTLVFDLQNTHLAIPRTTTGWDFHLLMPKVMDYLGSGIELDVTPRNNQPYYLCDEPYKWLAPANGVLDMHIVKTLIEELSWRVPIGLQNALSDFWSARGNTGSSRWQWFSLLLKDMLSLSAAQQDNLNDNHRALIKQLLDCPVRQDRVAQYGEKAARVYLVKATLTQPARTSRLSTIMLIEGPGQLIAWFATGPLTLFSSLDAFIKKAGRILGLPKPTQPIEFERFELEGDVFEIRSATLLNRQLENLNRLKLPASIGWAQLEEVYKDMTNVSTGYLKFQPVDPKLLLSLQQHLPDWLKTASFSDQALYRHFSLALASTKKSHQGRTFLSGISDVRTYTVDVLKQLLFRDKLQYEPESQGQTFDAQLAPDDIELTFHSVVGLPGAVGIEEPVTMSLTDLALKNLQGRPTGRLTLRHRRGLELPAWLTPAYITRRSGLIEQANIGEAYPKRLESLLLSDTPDAQERERLYAQYLRVQLPLHALELSLKKESGVTPLGARYVAALVKTLPADRIIDGQTVVIRQLALIREHEATPDIVSNMFIIEPVNIAVGPHLLYRPFYAQSLIEFATRDALLSALAEPGELQDSVLTWLSDSARPIYDNGGFKEPHYVRFGIGDEFAPIEVPAPASLATNGTSNELLHYLHNGQVMLYLYGSNAKALVDQADADSVSNSESRWRVLLQGGGLIFDSLLVLPGLPRTFMLTGWLLSLAHSATQDIPALASDSPTERELAMVDVLINLGMLLLHMAPGSKPGRPAQIDALRAESLHPLLMSPQVPEWPEPEIIPVRSGPVRLPGEYPDPQSTLLDFSFANASNRLTRSQRARLATFEVTRPATLPSPQTYGASKGLYRIQQKWHAEIDQALYEVELEADGRATIVAPSDSNTRGPGIRADANGTWALDLRLRLNGGMPPRRIAAYQHQKQARIEALNTTLQTIYGQERTLYDNVLKTQQFYVRASNDPRFTFEQLEQFRARFEMALSQEMMAYQELIGSINERIELKIPLSEAVVIGLLEKAFDNRATGLSSIATEQRIAARKWPQFATPLSPQAATAAAEADPAGILQFAKEQIAINERAIERLAQRTSILDQLNNLSNAGSEAANRLTANLSEHELTSLTLKNFQLSCLKLASAKPLVSFKIEESLENAIDPVREYVHTHNQLNTLELEPGKRLEVLDSLVEHYGQALDAVQGIGLIHSDELDIEYFSKLRQLITELYQEATEQLAAEIKPPPKPRKKIRRRQPSATSRTQRKVINARGKGSLIGSVRPAGGEWPIEVVEIRAEYDNKLLSTYTQHGDEWVEIKSPRHIAPTPKRSLEVIKGQARKLFGMFEQIQRKVKQYKRQTRHPQEIEEILSHEATKFDRLADELHAAWLEQPEAARLPADQILVNDMHTAAQQLDQEGKALRLQLCLELPPTHGNLQFLLDQRRVQISRMGQRVPLSGERKDYIQEYAISEPGKTPLWYAHFHYERADTPKEVYTVAHLKTREQRTMSYFSQLNTAQNEQAVVTIHRGQIGKALAERWFLPLAD